MYSFADRASQHMYRFADRVSQYIYRFSDQASQYIYLSINQIDAQNVFTISFISCLYMFRAHVLIITRSDLYYTASGIIIPIGLMIPEAV